MIISRAYFTIMETDNKLLRYNLKYGMDVGTGGAEEAAAPPTFGMGSRP